MRSETSCGAGKKEFIGGLCWSHLIGVFWKAASIQWDGMDRKRLRGDNFKTLGRTYWNATRSVITVR